jgi:hypothetical protein
MKVWNKGVHESPVIAHSQDKDVIQEKIILFAPIFITQLGKYFESLNYGPGVNEILYREYILKDGYAGKLLYYGPKKKIIDCAIVGNFETAVSIPKEEFGKYIAALYLERSKEFKTLNVKNFDCDSFLADLTAFFTERNLL